MYSGRILCLQTGDEAGWEGPRDFTYFVGRLAHQLVFNQFLGEGMNLRNHDDDLENDEEVSYLICLCFEHFSFWLLSQNF